MKLGFTQVTLQVGTKIDEQLAEVALCRLDFSINNPSSLALHRRDIKNEIKTLLDEGSAKEECDRIAKILLVCW